MTLHASIDGLQAPRVFTAIRLAIQGTNGFAPDDFRIVHFSVDASRVYLIAEARDARCLSSGARSIAIRIARYVNDTLARTGSLWADRWRRRRLKTPDDVRRALLDVLTNFRRHAPKVRAGIDPYSSAAWFDGFRGWTPASGALPPFAEPGVGVAPSFSAADGRKKRKPATNGAELDGAQASPVLPPRSALLATGWRKLGLIGLREAPNEPRKAKSGARSG
jgi:hypothetical protein